MPEKYTTYFRSVIAFGQIRILESDKEKWTVMKKLALKYTPESTSEERESAIRRDWLPLCVLEMTIDHVTGKEAIELVRSEQ